MNWVISPVCPCAMFVTPIRLAGFSPSIRFSSVNLWLSCHEGFFVNVYCNRERIGSVVECFTQVRRAAGSSLTGVTALCP